MNRVKSRLALFIGSLLAIACACSIAAAATEAKSKPNVVFIFADDFGWGDLKCYGHPYAKTPNIDSLATAGTRFLQCYATGVTCCPSRTGFMTSKLPATYAIYPANGGFGDRVTVTELLKKNGYHTGHFGKWHIGPETKAGTYGIDEIGDDSAVKKRRDDPAGRDSSIYDSAIRFIEQHKDGPFYLNVWSHISHHPINPAQPVLDAFGPLQVDESKFPGPMQEKFATCKKLGGDVSVHMRAYLADVKSMDDSVGRLLKRLDDLGLRENTIVVFSSDQGPAPLRDADEGPKTKKNRPNKKKAGKATDSEDMAAIRLNAMGSAGLLRGGKHLQYDGGVRIPFIVRWPGQVPAGRVDSNSVISGADWLPTLCTLTSTALNAADCDGEDASKAWLGGDFTRTKPLLWKTSIANSAPAIRIDNWKLHLSTRKNVESELYDIAADPGETTNLASKHPNIVAKLSARLEAWTTTLPKEYIKTDDKDE